MSVAAKRRLTDQDRYFRDVSESALQTRVIETAKAFGWLVHHARPAMRQSGQWSTPIQGAPGYPDLTMVRGGRVIFAELKTEVGKVTDWQERWLKELAFAGDPGSDPLEGGVECYVWRPSAIEEIAKVLT